MALNLTVETLTERLERWGSDTGSWPAADAEAAHELLARSAAARAALAQTVALEQMLNTLSPEPASPSLKAAILNAGTRSSARVDLLGWFRATLWRPVAAAAAALVFGFLLGILEPPGNESAFSDEPGLLALSDVGDLSYYFADDYPDDLPNDLPNDLPDE